MSKMQMFQMSLQMRQGAPFTEEDPAPFSMDTISYVIGSDFARNMADFDLVFDDAAFAQGAMDAKNGAESLIGGTNDDMMQALTMKLQEKQMAMQAEMQAEAAKEAEVHIEEGKAFIAEKAQEAGVKSTPSGLHYKVIQEGSGASPGPADQVTDVHFLEQHSQHHGNQAHGYRSELGHANLARFVHVDLHHADHQIMDHGTAGRDDQTADRAEHRGERDRRNDRK